MRIFITQVGHPNFRGGGNTVAHELSEAFHKKGHSVTAIFVAPKHLYREKLRTNYRSIILKQSKLPSINCIKVALAVSKSIRKEGGADVIISLGYEGLLIPLVKRTALFIAASHNFIQPIFVKDLFKISWLFPWNWGIFLYTFQRLLDKLTKQRADCVQTLCDFGREQCEKLHGISSKKIFVVPNGVKSEEVSGKKREASGAQKTLLFMGGSSHHKGLDILLRALPMVFDKHPEMKVMILGEMKREENALRLLAEKLGIMDRLIWRGLVFKKEMGNFYKKTAISVFPSRLDTFPLGVLESMTYGIAVVATKVGGIPEIIEDGVNGLIVPPEDPDAIAKALIRLLDDSSLAAKIGERARGVAKTKFSWDKVVEVFEAEINERLA